MQVIKCSVFNALSYFLQVKFIFASYFLGIVVYLVYFDNFIDILLTHKTTNNMLTKC